MTKALLYQRAFKTHYVNTKGDERTRLGLCLGASQRVHSTAPQRPLAYFDIPFWGKPSVFLALVSASDDLECDDKRELNPTWKSFSL